MSTCQCIGNEWPPIEVTFFLPERLTSGSTEASCRHHSMLYVYHRLSSVQGLTWAHGFPWGIAERQTTYQLTMCNPAFFSIQFTHMIFIRLFNATVSVP